MTCPRAKGHGRSCGVPPAMPELPSTSLGKLLDTGLPTRGRCFVVFLFGFTLATNVYCSADRDSKLSAFLPMEICTPCDAPLTQGEGCSVPSEFFRTDVVIVNVGFVEHRVQTLHHPWRPGYVVDRRRRTFEMFGKHGLIDAPRFSLP